MEIWGLTIAWQTLAMIYGSGFLISWAALQLLFSALGYQKYTAYIATFFGGLLFPVIVPIFLIFSVGTAVAHSTKLLVYKQ